MGTWLVDILKKVVSIVIPIGTGAIINNIVTEAVKNENQIVKACASITGTVADIGVSAALIDIASNKIDELDQTLTKKKEE